jgi:hypothetical protein
LRLLFDANFVGSFVRNDTYEKHRLANQREKFLDPTAIGVSVSNQHAQASGMAASRCNSGCNSG